MIEIFGFSISWFVLLFDALCIFVLLRIVRALRYEIKIWSLGGSHAPVFPVYLPFALDFYLSTVLYATRHRFKQYFEMLFAHASPQNPYVLEARVSPDQRWIFTIDPRMVKVILTTQFDDFGKGEKFREAWTDVLGQGILTQDHASWHDSRAMLRPMFARDRIGDLDIFERNVQKLISTIPGDGREVEVLDLLFRYTLDIATEYLFGSNVNSLENPNHEFAAAFTKVQHIQSLIVRAGPWSRFIPKGEFHRQLRVLDDFVSGYVSCALTLTAEELRKVTKSEKDYTFLHALACFTRDPRLLRDHVITSLLAARDTTASTMAWVVWELSGAPSCFHRLRSEILSTIGDTKPPTYRDLKNMKYLQAVLNETLRLWPAVPFNYRYALRDTVIPFGGGTDGTKPLAIVKDDLIAYAVLTMQLRAEIYPPPSSAFPDVNVFAPERWLNWTPKPWTYVPFNGGPRICLGQQFALTEMGYTIVRLLQRFERLERKGKQEQYLQADIVGRPGAGVRVGLWETTNL